jgi:Tfp pilus assembly ATPase PilU
MKTLRYIQRKGLATRIVDGESFIITRTTIKHFNATATLIWLALKTAATQKDLTELMHEIFPDIPRTQIQADVAKALRAFVAQGIVEKIRT